MSDSDPFLACRGGEGRTDADIKSNAIILCIIFGAFVWFGIIVAVVRVCERFHS